MPQTSSSRPSRVRTAPGSRASADEQVEFAGPQVDPAIGDRRLAPPRIDPEDADLDRPPAPRRDLGPSQDRLDPGHQGARVERLRDVVVGAQLEADDRVDVVVAGGQDQDRRVAAAAQLAAHLEPIPTRQHQVQDHEVRVVARLGRERLVAVARR